MSNITILGLGAMGSRMAMRLLNTGHAVTVWNRTTNAAEALVSSGAKAALTPAEAVVDADFVISMVRDDAASRYLWLDRNHGALAGMRSKAIAIESSTLTPGWITSLAADMRQQNIQLVEAPVSGSRKQIEAGQLAYLLGGDPSTVERCMPVLSVLGSKFHHLGNIGQGAIAKLATNALMAVQVTCLAEIIALLDEHSEDSGRILAAMSDTTVWPAIAGYLTTSMMQGDFTPQFTVELIEKDLSYALRDIEPDLNAPTISAACGAFQKAIAKGLAQQNMTSVVQLYKK